MTKWPAQMILWAYFQTDGDAGWYHVRLFKTKDAAERYRSLQNSAYGRVEQIMVED